mmetsp:Transcript_21296/g.50001  ORF Transcript_21296/g.50001 Transcript_21296/m.50001 type:complete len:312 (-) Transcript_21296:1744-2679(-)
MILVLGKLRPAHFLPNGVDIHAVLQCDQIDIPRCLLLFPLVEIVRELGVDPRRHRVPHLLELPALNFGLGTQEHRAPPGAYPRVSQVPEPRDRPPLVGRARPGLVLVRAEVLVVNRRPHVWVEYRFEHNDVASAPDDLGDEVIPVPLPVGDGSALRIAPPQVEAGERLADRAGPLVLVVARHLRPNRQGHRYHAREYVLVGQDGPELQYRREQVAVAVLALLVPHEALLPDPGSVAYRHEEDQVRALPSSEVLREVPPERAGDEAGDIVDPVALRARPLLVVDEDERVRRRVVDEVEEGEVERTRDAVGVF